METEIVKSDLILKNLHQVLLHARQRFENEFQMQEVVLRDNFKIAFRNFLAKRDCAVEYFDHTTIVTNSSGQNIYIANQWFVIASYFVDFCTEMQSYRELFIKIGKRMGYGAITKMNPFAERLRSTPTSKDKEQFLHHAVNVLREEFPNSSDNYNQVAYYLWMFASDYKWWAGSKTINRHDFFISSILNQLNVVNANSEYLAIIVDYYSSVLSLRILVDKVETFTVGFIPKKSTSKEPDTPQETDRVHDPIVNNYGAPFAGISISAASFERFHSN